MLNPINHATGPEDTQVYKVEPYVACADIYAAPPHVGRGGWTWYTGAAGWMYRLAVETLVGLHLEVDRLRLTPRVPVEWESYKIHYRYRETFYHITVTRAPGPAGGQAAAPGAGQASAFPTDRAVVAATAPAATVSRIVLDGVELQQAGDARGTIPLIDDRHDHDVRVEFTSGPGA
jgi:cellobiose phosphorylase